VRRHITLSEVVEEALRGERASTYHCMPGSVVAYHSDEQTADIQPTVNDVRFELSTGDRFSEPWPVIPHVPVCWPRFGGYALAGPMRAGDNVTLVAFDLDPTAWRQTGNRSDPADARRHVGSYWQALPCDITAPGVMKDAAAAAGALVIGLDGGQPQIRINGTTVQLGATGGDAVALASKVDAVLTLVQAMAIALGAVPPTGPLAPLGAAITAAGALGSGVIPTGSLLIKAQ
jgi:hypothetical protein